MVSFPQTTSVCMFKTRATQTSHTHVFEFDRVSNNTVVGILGFTGHRSSKKVSKYSNIFRIDNGLLFEESLSIYFSFLHSKSYRNESIRYSFLRCTYWYRFINQKFCHLMRWVVNEE